MRSFGAAALVTLALITECLGARSDSDRSRHRSGPIKSVPVAADIKRDIDFDCPEEFGYYPHPTDCTLYYVCVFGGALLESCTGGLMYSHELQTCDWPRNVGCDGTSAIGGEELERISEREPPPPPPQSRRKPPPPPRAQPKPVITSRGQPKYIRDEYEKQQQLYAEVDDLPPVEEIESDRQQRVNRGQPSTIGQVQKDRDGYSSQLVSSRTLNSNIIPASIPQNGGKLGSFSFGTQDDRRAAAITQAPQSYSEDKSDNVTDSHHDRQFDIETNEIDSSDVTEKAVTRVKREAIVTDLNLNDTNSTKLDEITKRQDIDAEIEYIEVNPEKTDEDLIDGGQDDSERGKRQITYYQKNPYKNPGKNWAVQKPIKLIESNYNPHPQNQNHRYHQPSHTGANHNYNEANRRPHSYENNLFSTMNPFLAYQVENVAGQRPFKASLPDPMNQRFAHNPLNPATQIITKSPPISSLTNNENPFSAITGFYNSFPQPYSNQNNQNQYSQSQSAISRPNSGNFHDSSQLPSTIVTGKPVLISSSPRNQNKYRIKPEPTKVPEQPQKGQYPPRTASQKQIPNKPADDEEEEDDNEDEYESEEESSENNNDDFDYPEPPYEFTHPKFKYVDIKNPFADPNFDFDSFLSKLSNGQYPPPSSTPRPVQSTPTKAINALIEVTTASNHENLRSSSVNYKGMSTPKGFTPITMPGSPARTVLDSQVYSTKHPDSTLQSPRPSLQAYIQQQDNHSHNENEYSRQPSQNAGLPLDAVRPKLKPPNFKDDRELPISYSFNRAVSSTHKPNYEQGKQKGETKQVYSVTQKPYIVVTSTGTPIYLSTSKLQYMNKPEKYIVSTGKPYIVSSVNPNNAYTIYKHSTAKPLTTLANEQLSALQQYWNNKPTPNPYSVQTVTFRPNSVSEIPSLENLFSQTIKPSLQAPVQNQNSFQNIDHKNTATTTTTQSPKRRPIPKPSPEMNDYYYDEDEDIYYEPPVKPKYMPSSEVKPQRPPMAQNYKQYDDNYSYENDSEELTVNIRPRPHTTPRRPIKYTLKPESITKNHNDLSVVTKSPPKDFNKNENGKIPVPVMVDYGTPAPTVLIRPQVTHYENYHSAPRNRTVYIRKPTHLDIGPNTNKPPKYLNQTTLRPYTVRHRLAKPTTVQDTTVHEDKPTTGRVRHPNLVVQKLTTTPDSHNQETRFTKNRHDDKSNSLEPTENVVPVSYSASPRPKMLYNGSQNYSPDHYDPYYAVYDEDGELYKDTDYVQQYNTASLRPAVQQTYRGTPPPARRPVETYTPRPVASDDYDNALLQGQINNQNQYQTPIRHSTRGEGNDLGYEHNPSSGRTTFYEATPISTIPPTTTSTSTTTQRTTTAPFTEAMTPSRYTPRSSTDENPIPNPESTLSPSGESVSISSTRPSIISISSLAKPFEKTDNSRRLQETVQTTEKLSSRRGLPVTNNNNNDLPVEVVRPSSNRNNKKKGASLTTGFSIRRNLNNTNNPYTLTVLTRSFDEYHDRLKRPESTTAKKAETVRNYVDGSRRSLEQSVEPNIENTDREKSSDRSIRRKDSVLAMSDEADIPVNLKPTRIRLSNPHNTDHTESTTPSTTTTKYYLKTVIRRPAPFSSDEQNLESTENTINTEALIENALRNAQTNQFSSQTLNDTSKDELPIFEQYDEPSIQWEDPIGPPYETLDNIRNSNKNDNEMQDYITPPSSSSTFSTTTPKEFNERIVQSKKSRSKPSYYSYRLEDEVVPDQTTEILSGRVKNVIKAFFGDFGRTTLPDLPNEFHSTPFTRPTTSTITTTTSTTTPIPDVNDKVVNIGFQQSLKHADEKSLRGNFNRLRIVTEPSVNRYNPDVENIYVPDQNDHIKDYPSTTPYSSTLNSFNFRYSIPETTSMLVESSKNEHQQVTKEIYESKFKSFVTSKPEEEKSRKFYNIISGDVSTEHSVRDENLNDESTKRTKISIEATKTPTEIDFITPTSKFFDDITTTSTPKTTTTVKIESTTSTTKSLSFPTRASRVNPAIKLAATNPGGGRRSYQSSSKCSSDNSLQANPKCNEIKYQRPTTSTRGRGSAHYSKTSATESSQPAPNRGTPPTRSRPTLKPSTAIVTKTTEFVDIYAHPPSRPPPVYPQPTPDKTAAKCRKDVCLLPDCYCGGKEIPGDLPVETVPQIVLLTFDDSVNDLNKGLYTDLFEKGRVNPNGCPISATFYVSHEWTDYSQVQNLYSAGHEMASHTVSHSFGEQFSQKKWNREVGGQREILAAYGGVKLEDVRGMRAPFLSVGGNKMFKMLHDSNFTYDSSLPVYENKPPSWPYTLDYKLFHDCMIPPCPTKSYPGVWEVPMVMWQDLNGGRCSMGDACANPPEPENVYKMILKNFDRHYTTNRAPFGLFYHAAWFTQPHHKEGFIMFLDFINQMNDVWIITNWQALQWVRDPTPINRLNNFQPFQCNYQDRPKKCNNPKVCNLWHKSGVRYMRTCQPCPEIYPWTGKSGIRSSRIDNDNSE